MSNLEREWGRKVFDKAKLRTYVTFKQNYSTESYVRMNLSRPQRSYLAQFRCGILPLRIETGRFRNEAIGNRTCCFCNNGEVEDETHFLLKCNFYDEFRANLLEQVVIIFPNFAAMTDSEKMKILLIGFVRQTAKCIEKSINKRKRHLYN